MASGGGGVHKLCLRFYPKWRNLVVYKDMGEEKNVQRDHFLALEREGESFCLPD